MKKYSRIFRYLYIIATVTIVLVMVWLACENKTCSISPRVIYDSSTGIACTERIRNLVLR